MPQTSEKPDPDDFFDHLVVDNQNVGGSHRKQSFYKSAGCKSRARLIQQCSTKIQHTHSSVSSNTMIEHQVQKTERRFLSQKDGKTICKRQVHLKPGSSDFIKHDGEEWLAIEAGTFQPTGITREISFNLLDCSTNWKSGLVFAGVEIRAVSTLSYAWTNKWFPKRAPW
ncbi:hypothetical protein EJ110_NYTH43892 [Nymphaea thermarum]|nr:hypothetical protein EJ110_NYTH43892 [Nymphaea thermarum]